MLCVVMMFFYNWMCNNTPSTWDSLACLRKTFIVDMGVCLSKSVSGVNKMPEYGLGRKAKWLFNSGLTTDNTERKPSELTGLLRYDFTESSALCEVFTT